MTHMSADSAEPKAWNLKIGYMRHGHEPWPIYGRKMCPTPTYKQPENDPYVPSILRILFTIYFIQISHSLLELGQACLHPKTPQKEYIYIYIYILSSARVLWTFSPWFVTFEISLQQWKYVFNSTLVPSFSMGDVNMTSRILCPSLVTNGKSPPSGPACPMDGLLHTFNGKWKRDWLKQLA